MKAILEFTMPDDEVEFNMAKHGDDYHAVLWQLSQSLRTYLKHGHTFKDADTALESIQRELYDRMDENDCRFQP